MEKPESSLVGSIFVLFFPIKVVNSQAQKGHSP